MHGYHALHGSHATRFREAGPLKSLSLSLSIQLFLSIDPARLLHTLRGDLYYYYYYYNSTTTTTTARLLHALRGDLPLQHLRHVLRVLPRAACPRRGSDA